MSHKRWYDIESHLSQVVRSMEFMNESSQARFGERLFEISEEILAQRGGDAYIAELSEDVKAGLEKAESRNRWYDKDDNLHKAFKNLYSLGNSDRRQIAVLMLTPVKIVKGYEQYCKQAGQTPDINVIDEILRTSLTAGPKRAENLYQIYLMDTSAFKADLGQSSTEAEDKGVWSELLSSIQQALAFTS